MHSWEPLFGVGLCVCLCERCASCKCAAPTLKTPPHRARRNNIFEFPNFHKGAFDVRSTQTEREDVVDPAIAWPMHNTTHTQHNTTQTHAFLLGLGCCTRARTFARLLRAVSHLSERAPHIERRFDDSTPASSFLCCVVQVVVKIRKRIKTFRSNRAGRRRRPTNGSQGPQRVNVPGPCKP